MKNSHDEIKKLLKASRSMLSNNTLNEQITDIKSKYGIITEQGSDLTAGNISKKMNISKSVEDKIEDDIEPEKDKSQGYRISGGILVLHANTLLLPINTSHFLHSPLRHDQDTSKPFNFAKSIMFFPTTAFTFFFDGKNSTIPAFIKYILKMNNYNMYMYEPGF